MGAWIEIIFRINIYHCCFVAPLVGAWIEISHWKAQKTYFSSLPSWERGLKFKHTFQQIAAILSLPSWERGLKWIDDDLRFTAALVAPLVGAWIEIDYTENAVLFVLSLPSWERGLKYRERKHRVPVIVSLPSWERGLKFYTYVCFCTILRRSPRGSVD